MDLGDFLLARIAEDEAAARAAGGEWWDASEMPPPSMRRAPDEPTHWIIDSPATLVSYEFTSREKARHASEWNPARVLGECEAKRRVVEEHAPLRKQHNGITYCRMCVHPFGFNDEGDDGTPHRPPGVPYPCLTLQLLALPYADHADWREEWRQ